MKSGNFCRSLLVNYPGVYSTVTEATGNLPQIKSVWAVDSQVKLNKNVSFILSVRIDYIWV